MRAKCPVCNKEYNTIIERINDSELVQLQYPNSPEIAREQLITGICSNKCWNKYTKNLSK